MTCVAAFESVGAILVIAFIAIPSAAAFLFSKQMNVMISLAIVFGVVGVIAGTLGSNIGEGLSSSGVIVMCLGLIFVVSIISKRFFKL